MSHIAPRPSKLSPLRRSGPLITTLVAVVLASIVVVSPGAGATSASKSGSPAVLSFTQAKKEGKVGSIDWGSRCNVATGKLKYPSFFAGQCYAPFHGSNGGATTQGVTAKVIKIVFYVPEANDPILTYIEAAVKDNATNAQTIETMQNWVTFYNHFFETYGRTVDLDRKSVV